MNDMGKEIYLTFDMDWVIDEVLEDMFKLIKEHDVTGTIHVTHNTIMNQKFHEELGMELGIHPNFNFILNGDLLSGEPKDIKGAFDKVKAIVPDAVCCRSHALTYSSIFKQQYIEHGIKYDLNQYIPAHSGLSIKAYKDSGWGGIRVPFIFEDDIYLDMKDKPNAAWYLTDEFDAPRVFNFHPFHLFLNTDKLETYVDAKPFYKNAACLFTSVNREIYGIRDFFIDLVNVAKENRFVFKRISEGSWV